MTETLTIVGASVRAAAQSALRAGYAPVAADLFADADLARFCPTTRIVDYPGEFAQVLAAGQPGGWMYTGGLENHPQLVAQWSQVRPLWGNGFHSLGLARDPQRIAAALRAAGLACPAIACRREQLTDNCRWLEKSLSSTSGFGVDFVRERDVTAPERPGVYYQQHIAGEACAAVYVACRGEARMLGVTRQLIGADWLAASAFRYCGSIGPLLLSAPELDQFQRIGSTFAAAFDLVGLFGVDAVLHNGVVWPVEINPRYTASVEVIEHATGCRAIALHMAACRAGKLPETIATIEPAAAPAGRKPIAAPASRPTVCGKAIVFARRPLLISAETSAQWLERAGGDSPDLADVPRPDTRIAPGDPIATLLAESADVEETLGRLRQQAAAFHAV